MAPDGVKHRFPTVVDDDMQVASQTQGTNVQRYEKQSERRCLDWSDHDAPPMTS